MITIFDCKWRRGQNAIYRKNADFQMQLGSKLLLSKEISHHEIRFECEKSVFSDFGIFYFIKEGKVEKLLNLKKIQIFERDLTYIPVKNFHARRIDLKAKKIFSMISDFSILRGSNGKIA